MKCLDKKRIKMKQGETLALNERIMLSHVSTGVRNTNAVKNTTLSPTLLNFDLYLLRTFVKGLRLSFKNSTRAFSCDDMYKKML